MGKRDTYESTEKVTIDGRSYTIRIIIDEIAGKLSRKITYKVTARCPRCRHSVDGTGEKGRSIEFALLSVKGHIRSKH